jgi:hypothetical protein
MTALEPYTLTVGPNRADSCSVELTEGWCQTAYWVKRDGPALPEGSPQYSFAGGQVQYESVREVSWPQCLVEATASSARAVRELGASSSGTVENIRECLRRLFPEKNILEMS